MSKPVKPASSPSCSHRLVTWTRFSTLHLRRFTSIAIFGLSFLPSKLIQYGPGWPMDAVRKILPSGCRSETPMRSMRLRAAGSSSQYTASCTPMSTAPFATRVTYSRYASRVSQGSPVSR